MNFSEAVESVIQTTKRPDKVVEIQQAVNAAILFFCMKGRFRQDLMEDTININSANYGDTISLAGLTRFRTFKYVKRPGVRGYLKPTEPEYIFTPGHSMQKDVYYVAGTNLTYILAAQAASLEVGYYAYPATLSGTASHWLLDIQPYCVIDEAAARVFKSIGDDNSARLHKGYAKEAFDVLLNDQSLGG